LVFVLFTFSNQMQKYADFSIFVRKFHQINIVMKKLFLLGIAILSASIAAAQDRRSGAPWVTRSEVIARNGMVCSSHPLATQVGVDILKKAARQ